MSIPVELITLFASSFFGGVMRAWSRSIDARRDERFFAINMLREQNRERALARRYDAPGIHWTRRVLALSAAFCVLVLPKVAAIFWPHIPIVVGYTELKSGFWLFSSATEVTRWVPMKGLVITPLDTHILSAVIGLYFGGSLIGHH